MSAAAAPVAAGLVHPQGDFYLCVHESERLAVDGDFATAAVLAALVFRSRLADQFQRTCRQLSADVQKCASESTIRKKCIPALVKKGFITVTEPEGNNKLGDWFTVHLAKIQAAIRGVDPGKKTGVDPGKVAALSIKSNSLKTNTAAAFKATSCVVPESESVPAAQNLPPETHIEPNPETSQETEAIRAELQFLGDTDPEELLAKYPLAKLKDGIAYTYLAVQRGIRSGNPIDNPAGFLRKALEKGWRVAEVVPITAPPPPAPPPAPDCDKCLDSGFPANDLDGFCDCDVGIQARRRAELIEPIQQRFCAGKIDRQQFDAKLSRVLAEAGL